MLLTSIVLASLTVIPIHIEHVLDRPLTWDPGGIVRISETQTITDQERSWIKEMKGGDYNKVFLNVSHQANRKIPTFLQLWIVSEACRKRNSLTELKRFVESLESRYGKTKETIFARIKLESQSLALILGTGDQEKIDATSKRLRELTLTADSYMKDCLPLSVVVGSLYVGETNKRRLSAEQLIVDNPRNTDLKLWKVRAFLNGPYGRRLGKDGKAIRGSHGRPLITTYPDSPDLKKAEELLRAYVREIPDDPRANFYQARLLSMKAYFEVQDDKQTIRLTQQAQKLIDTFLLATEMPRPMIDVAKRFKTLPYPGTFITLPTE